MACSLYSLYRRTGNEDLPTFEEAGGEARGSPARRRYLLSRGAAIHRGGALRREGGALLHRLRAGERLLPAVRRLRARHRRGLPAGPGIPRRRSGVPGRARPRQGEPGDPHAGDQPAPPPLAAETAAWLREHLAADVERLGALLGRDLSSWTRGEAVPPQAVSR